jgi:deoxyadenosine/deoxycytidine kinase
LAKLISVVGNSGVGKTTFVLKLCQELNYSPELEQHEERPYQELFMLHKRKYALANQIDYLIFRAQQEIGIRDGETPGVQDGGLDQDFFVFTKLFYHNKYLSENEYGICKRAYQVLRKSLPPPDLIIWMKASVELIAERYNRRNRRLDITQIEDMKVVEGLLEKWLGGFQSDFVLKINAELEDKSYSKSIPVVRDLIGSLA